MKSIVTISITMLFATAFLSCSQGGGNGSSGSEQANLKVNYYMLLEPAVVPGEDQMLRVVIGNQGQGPAPIFSYRVDFTSTDPGSSGQTGFSGMTTGPLDPGQELAVEGAIRIPTIGFTTISVFLDTNGNVPEQNESDNTDELFINAPVSN